MKKIEKIYLLIGSEKINILGMNKIIPNKIMQCEINLIKKFQTNKFKM